MCLWNQYGNMKSSGNFKLTFDSHAKYDVIIKVIWIFTGIFSYSDKSLTLNIYELLINLYYIK